MVGNTVLREVVRTDLLAAINKLYLRESGLAEFFLAARLLHVPAARLEHRERFLLVLQLRSLILAGYNQATWQVRDTYRRVCCIHALAAVTCRAVHFHTNIAVFNVNVDIVIGLWQHNDFRRGSMDTPVCLSDGNTLHAMRASLIFEATICPLTMHHKGDILYAALLSLVRR